MFDGEESYRVRMETTKGDVVIAVVSEWAPRGAERFKELVESGFYTDIRIFRVVPDFVVQFGMHGDPKVTKQWQEQTIEDDKVTQSNETGCVTFATSGQNARTTQVFINLKDNPGLDEYPQNFAPFGKVVEGMDVVRSFNSQYLDAPTGAQGQITEGGNVFLDEEYPGLDSIKSITLIEASAPEESADSTPPAADE
jgi:peptidyl-prolyl cis-trans isomerase A (cyclophilin A)